MAFADRSVKSSSRNIKQVQPSDEPGRKRWFKPKVKTGCRTCKKRRIKCDEAKPICGKCAKSKFHCEGYDGATVQAPQPLKPSLDPIPLQPRLSSNVEFLSETEFQYFDYFRDNLVRDFSWYFNAGLWNHLVPQACYMEPSLRSLSISISALSKSKSSNDQAALHETFALQQYAKALREVQEAINMETEPDAMRIALVASLLIFWLEEIQGDHAQAARHMQSALKIVKKRLGAMKFIQVKNSPSVPTTEHELLSQFMRLDSSFQTRLDGEEIFTSLLQEHYLGDFQETPRKFESLVDARNRVEHLIHCALPLFSVNPTNRTVLQTPGDDVAGSFACRVIQQLREWERAFAPLMASLTDDQLPAAATLQAMVLANDITIQKACLSSADPSPEPFVYEAKQIVKLCKSVVTHPAFQKKFVFDWGVLPILVVVITCGTERRVREEAVEICWAAEGRKEITWDAGSIARFGENLLREEFEGEVCRLEGVAVSPQ